MSKNFYQTNLSQELLGVVASYNSTRHQEEINKITELLNKGADATKVIHFDSPFSYAVKFNLLPVIKLFIEKKVDINSKFLGIWEFKNGKTEGYANYALCAAIQNNFNEIAELLIKNGAELSTNEKTKISPLHIAIHKGNLDMVKSLVNSGANINEKTCIFPQTAIELAKEENQEDIISYLNKLDIQILGSDNENF